MSIKTAKERIIIFVLLIFTSILIFLLPFKNVFSVNYVDGHDFLFHFHRIYILEEYLKKGIIFPRWISSANYGYGSPMMSFLWGVPYYLGSVLHIIGLSYPNVFRILVILPSILSGLGMFLWINRKYGNFVAFVSAIIFVWSPYRFVDSFVRGAIGELFFFAFFPFIFYFLDSPLTYKYLMSGMIFTALMIYSHQGLSLVGFAIILVYILIKYYLYKDKKTLYKQIFVLTGGLILTAFYWIPAIIYADLLPIGKTVSPEWFPPLLSLIRSPWQGGMVNGRYLIFSFQIGLAQLTIMLLAHIAFFFIKKQKNERILFIYWILLFWVSIFFMQPVSYFLWTQIPFMAYILYPFRLLFIPMFVSPILFAVILNLIKSFKRVILGISMIIFVFYANRNHLGVLNKQINMEEFVSYVGSYDVAGETLPKYINIKEMIDELKSNNKLSEFTIINGKGKIINQNRQDLISNAQISLDSNGSILIRRMYFPGWEIYVNNNQLKNNQFIKQNGVIIPLRGGSYSIKMQYSDPLLIKISNIISIVFFSFLVIKLFFNNIRISRKKRSSGRSRNKYIVADRYKSGFTV